MAQRVRSNSTSSGLRFNLRLSSREINAAASPAASDDEQAAPIATDDLVEKYAFSSWLRPIESIAPLAQTGKRFCALLDILHASDLPAEARVRALIADVNAGLAAGFEPRLADEGTGGAYLLRDAKGGVVAIFKPSDEEPYTPNNPRGLSSPSPHSPFLGALFGSHGTAELNARDPRRARVGTMPTTLTEFGLLLSNRATVAAAVAAAAAHAEPASASELATKRIRSGVPGGSAACREFAAFALDRGHSARVPLTMLAVVQHEAFHVHDEAAGARATKTKIGSLQEFVEHDYAAEDLSMNKIRRFPVAQVHEIAMFDIRMFNTDRHGGNILVRERSVGTSPSTPRGGGGADEPGDDSMPFFDADAFGASLSLSVDSLDDDGKPAAAMMRRARDDSSTGGRSTPPTPVGTEPQLIPIDHGLTLPENMEEAYFEWLTWPQARVPFSAEAKRRIAALSWQADAKVLRHFGSVFTGKALRVLRVAHLLLKLGAAHDLSPYAIATIMCREQLSEPSLLERTVLRVTEDQMLSSSGSSSDNSNKREESLDSEDDNDFFALLEPALLAVVRNAAADAQSRPSTVQQQNFAFDDL